VKVQGKEVQLATRLTAEQAARVVAFAEEYGMSVSAVIRLAVLKILDEMSIDPVLKLKK
jgi:antitoxin component of RelBE/YafQ-DinJ toxin-antitoxin module